METEEQIRETLKKRIAELEKTVQVLEQDLIHDQLTGLKTRAFFEEEARLYFDIVMNTQVSYQTERKQWFGFKNMSFIFVDIDYFKNINDTYGHASGDEVLKKVAEAVMASVREGDTAARFGGEEIIVTLVGATEGDAIKKAEDIRQRIEALVFEKIPSLKVTASVGVASAEANHPFEEILDRADKAVYEAKRRGRNNSVSYSEIAGRVE